MLAAIKLTPSIWPGLRLHTLVVWKLDRLGRSTLHCIEIANELRGRGINLASVIDGIDTGTTNGRLYSNILAALGEAVT